VISAGNDLARSAAGLGVAGSMRKPLDLDKLLEAVARHA
jgi:hypothetical protein